MNFKHLRYFWTVAKAGGVMRAGEQLNTTPQTLSGQIKQLEEWLGHDLFRKRGRGLELTSEGRVALGYAEQIFALGDELEKSIRLARGQEKPLEFRVGVADSIAKSVAYHLLEPIVGTALAGLLFGIALLAAGQSSTFTGTIAGQVLMEGFLDLRIPCWQRRLITRALALVPAFIGVAMLGDHAIGKLLVISQVVLGLQLPFAMLPLIRMTGDRTLMGVFVSSRLTSWLAWGLFIVISIANVWLVWQVLTG